MAKGYDFQFIMNYCITQNIRHKSIYNGSKIMYLEIQHGLHLRFVDSFNFMTMPLKNMPATFGLCELKKGYFAHLFNTEEHQKLSWSHATDTGLPFGSHEETEQSTFRLWYKHQKDIYQRKLHYWKHVLVNIDKNTKEPVEYDLRRSCWHTVPPMWIFYGHSCLCFRKLFMEVAGCDPFQKITIASLCMNIYRAETYA